MTCCTSWSSREGIGTVPLTLSFGGGEVVVLIHYFIYCALSPGRVLCTASMIFTLTALRNRQSFLWCMSDLCLVFVCVVCVFICLIFFVQLATYDNDIHQMRAPPTALFFLSYSNCRRLETFHYVFQWIDSDVTSARVNRGIKPCVINRDLPSWV